MHLYEVIWKDRFLDKLASEHGVASDEIEDVQFSGPHVRFAEKGRVRGENLYVAYGQTTARRYLLVFFIHKRQTAPLPVSARDMTRNERRYYREQKEGR